MKMMTLTTQGTVQTLNVQASAAMSHALTCRHSDVPLIRGKAFSVQKYVEEYGHSSQELITHLQGGFEEYFRNLFDNVQVQISLAPGSTNDGRYALEVTIQCYQGQESVSIARLMTVDKSMLKDTVDYFNYGPEVPA